MGAVSAVGRYHSVGWDRSVAPATQKQRWALWFASDKKIDFRNSSKLLSEEQADALIKKYNAEKKSKPTPIKGGQLETAMFMAVMRKAVEAANAAGKTWEAAHPEPSYYIYHEETDFEEPVYGTLGDVYVRWPHKRTKFGMFLRNHFFDNQYERVHIPHNYVGRREYDLLLVCEQAALDVFTQNQVLGLKLIKMKAE